MIEYLPQVLSSLSAATTIAKAMIGVRDESLLSSKILELQKCIIDAQQTVLSAQSEQAKLVKTMAEMERECERLKDWSVERESFECVRVGTGVFAYLPKERDELRDCRKFCANCFEKGVKATLQSEVKASYFGSVHHLICPNGCPGLKVVGWTDDSQRGLR